MSKMKTHVAVQIENRHGGHITDTLCGRSSAKSDGYNSSENREEVSCLVCSSIASNPKHWRYRKYLDSKVKTKLETREQET